jgi:hypothetical protein
MYCKPILVIVIAALVNMLIGCDLGRDGEKQAKPTEINQPTEALEVYDVSVCETGEEVRVLNPQWFTYASSNYGAFAKALENGEVKATIAKFTAEGYQLDLGNSLIVQGQGIVEGTEDTLTVKIVNLIMRYLPDTTQSIIWISHRTILNHPELPILVDATICFFVNPGDDAASYDYFDFGVGSTGVSRGLWAKSYISPFGTSASMMAEKTVNKKYQQCVTMSAAVGCAFCAWDCSLTGPAYLICVAACCQQALKAAMVACAICVLFC